MGYREALASAVGGRRSVLLLGGIYVTFAVTYPLLPMADDASLELWLVLGILVGGSGLVLLIGGYRLSQTGIRPELYPTVATWCLRGVVAGIAIMVPIVLASSDSNVVPNTLLLTALGSLAGFAAGVFDARAKTRQLELAETVERLEHSNQRLERYKQYTDDILDSIDDVFYVLDETGNLKRWNESLSEVTGYSNEEIASMTAAEFFVDEDREAAMAAVRDGFEGGSVHVELDVQTRDGTAVPFEFVASRLEDPFGDAILAGIGRDVTERVEREQRLQASNERLEQFAYAASHDLQEPLRMVSSYLQLIEHRAGSELSDETTEFLEYAVDGADRMRAMIDGLLQYSRVEARGKPLEPVALDDVVGDVRDNLAVQITESDARVDIEALPRVMGDPDQLRQVFQNLLSNALEYSGDDAPRVAVSAERDGEMWEISVRDEGIGVAPDDHDDVFGMFERLHSRDEHAGSGIGLALCERIIERHGGDIWVDSAPGEGSTFSFTVPAVDTHDE